MNRNRAVLYARTYSGDESQAEAEPQEQIDVCRKYAEEKGLEVVAEFITDSRISSNRTPMPHWR